MKHRIPALLCALLLILGLSGCEAAPAVQASPPPEGSTLAVHFIDVGQADAALLLCGGQAMLIDGGNVADSSLVVSYLERQGVEALDYVVCTHAHEDHVGGLSGPLNTCTAAHVLSPVADYDSKAFRDFAKYTAAQGLELEIPAPGDAFPLGEAEVTVLGPVRDYGETNNTSLVLRVEFGETSFLFTGDMEREAEADLLEAGAALESTVLKVGHHGSDTSTSYPFLRAVAPRYAVISVGEGNSYGHPTEAALSRLRDADATVYRTDLQGTVVAVSDGTSVSFTTGRDAAPTPGRADEGEMRYIGNANSHVFHLDTCSGLPAEKNRVEFASRAEAAAAGYTPCGRCKP